MRTKTGAAQRMVASETISKSADDVGHNPLGFGPLLLFWHLVWTDHRRSSDSGAGSTISVSPTVGGFRTPSQSSSFSVSVPPLAPAPGATRQRSFCAPV